MPENDMPQVGRGPCSQNGYSLSKQKRTVADDPVLRRVVEREEVAVRLAGIA